MLARRLAPPLALAVETFAAGGGCETIGNAAGSFEPNQPGTLTVITQPLPTDGF